MRAIRIHVDQPLSPGLEVELGPSASEHVARVLRLGVGDPVILFNGDGCDYAGVLSTVGKRGVQVRVGAGQALHNESPLALSLAQGVARGDKMDLVVQKATELGVVQIVPLLTERSDVKLDPARSEKRLLHWRAVAASACEQCGRARVPEVLPAQSLSNWLASLAGDRRSRLALLPHGTLSAREVAFAPAGGVLVAGPEGGLGERDVVALSAAGFDGLALGPRILRTETAGLAALAALQALHGDL